MLVDEVKELDQAIEWMLAEPRYGTAVGVVAVSGGPDSVALLHALVRRHASPLVVAHLNHRLRGVESDADEEFVRQLVATLRAAAAASLTLECRRLDVAAAARASGENLEAAARRLRYDWLIQVARGAGAAWIATGHTADDQAETVLHHLLRGSGLRGLSGIARRRELAPGIDLVRPLLAMRKATLLAFLEAEGLACRQDRSNEDPNLMRNRIRHELLPLLSARFNAGVVEHLTSLAQQAEQVQSYLEDEARAVLERAELPRSGPLVILQPEILAGAKPAILCEVFRLIWQREGWPMGAMDFTAWQRVAQVARGASKAVDLPGTIRVRRADRVIQVGPA
jgi:tRNA(Ile)-lysidine synthase